MNTSGAFVDCSEISKADFFSFFVLFSLSQSLIYIFNIVLLVQVLLNSHFWDSHSWGCKDLINMETQRLAIFLFSLYVSNYGLFFFFFWKLLPGNTFLKFKVLWEPWRFPLKCLIRNLARCWILKVKMLDKYVRTVKLVAALITKTTWKRFLNMRGTKREKNRLSRSGVRIYLTMYL